MALSSNRIFAGLHTALEKATEPNDVVFTEQETTGKPGGIVLIDRTHGILYTVHLREVTIGTSHNVGELNAKA